MLLNSKQTLSHILEFTLCYPPMLLLFLLKKLTMNNFQLLKSPTVLLNQLTWWLNVIPDMVNIWLAQWCTEVMLFQRMLMLLLQPLRPRELFNSLTGALLDSKLELTINPQQLYQEVILLKWWELSVWFPTLLLLLKSSPD